MLNPIFDLFKTNPLISIIGIFVIVILILVLFRKTLEELLKLYIKEKYDLYNKAEISAAVQKSIPMVVSQNLEVKSSSATPIINSILQHLEHIKEKK